MNYIKFIVKRYLFALLSFIYVIVYWASAAQLPEDSIVFPKMVTCLLIPLFIWIIIQSIGEYRKLKQDTSVKEKEKWICSLNITKPKLIITLATIAYVALMPIVGYVVMTAIYVASLSFYLGNRNPLKLIAFTSILITVLYLIFSVWLHIHLPSGFLF